MIEIIKELKIEVSKPNIFQAVVAKQYDMNTRFIKATLVDGDEIICIPSHQTVKAIINAERPDGRSKGFDGEVNEDGTVTVPLHSWMLELDGTVICDISVIDTQSDDNKKLTTTSFTLLVEKAAYGGDDITTDPQFDILVSLLEASSVAQDALDKSNEANSKYDACVEATEVANATLGELESIKAELANGGYITSFREINHGHYLSFWVGTQAEYNALENIPQDCYVIITDDMTASEIISEMSSMNGYISILRGDLTTVQNNVSSLQENVNTLQTDYLLLHEKFAPKQKVIYGSNLYLDRTNVTIGGINEYVSLKCFIKLKVVFYGTTSYLETVVDLNRKNRGQTAFEGSFMTYQDIQGVYAPICGRVSIYLQDGFEDTVRALSGIASVSGIPDANITVETITHIYGTM